MHKIERGIAVMFMVDMGGLNQRRGAEGNEVEARIDLLITLSDGKPDDPGHLPHLYGAVNYAVLDKAGRLPLKVFDIYRRVTTIRQHLCDGQH
ncbi:MAG: hypothetical protein WC383_04920 [Gammaproteobacteria bacterium]